MVAADKVHLIETHTNIYSIHKTFISTLTKPGICHIKMINVMSTLNNGFKSILFSRINIQNVIMILDVERNTIMTPKMP